MNFYDVLAAEKWGGGIPTINFFDLLFAQPISGEQWRVYEGTLPATINANGSDLRQYQIWGNVGGVGDKTAQLFDKNAKNPDNGYLNNAYIRQSDGNYFTDTGYYLSEYISVEPNKLYTWVFTFSNLGPRHSMPTIEFLDASKNRISWAYHDISIYQFSVNTPTNCAFVRASVYKNTSYNSSLTLGSPETFVPFGYEVDMSVSDGTSNTTTPIYIGDEPLDKDEYMDYTEQKVYRRTANLFDISSAEPNKYINPNNGKVTATLYNNYVLSDYIYVAGYNTVTISSMTGSVAKQTGAHINCYDNSKNWIRGYLAYNAEPANTQKKFVVDVTDISYIRVDFATADLSQNMLTLGSTPSETYVPYIQPTVPPVPLPALPTCEGETIIDYAGESVAPEKVYFEYQGGKKP